MTSPHTVVLSGPNRSVRFHSRLLAPDHKGSAFMGCREDERADQLQILGALPDTATAHLFPQQVLR
ncbi:hypothetical protein [Deinococcus hopiensis]|nr:hypothetical protein [Deinococcus hopiensis]